MSTSTMSASAKTKAPAQPIVDGKKPRFEFLIVHVFVLIPIVALAVGWLIADEEITATTILGAAVVFAGVYLGALARSGRQRG